MNLGDATMGNDYTNAIQGSEGFKLSSGTGAVMAGSALGASSSSGSGNMVRCPLDDQSFYCQLSRGTNIVSMIIYLIFVFFVVIAFLYFLYDYLRGGKGSKNVRSSRR